MENYCVYKHTAPNGKVYIGITSQNVDRRWRNGNGYYQNEHFSRAIKIFGWENFQHEIMFEDLKKDEACEKEAMLIKLYKSNNDRFGYNKSKGGEKPAQGIKHSDETKKKMSLAHIGHRNTKEHCKKISDSKKGKSNGLDGKKGKDSNAAGIVYMIDSNTDEVIRTFNGYREMNRIMGFPITPVRVCANGMQKTSHGYKWKYEKRGTKNVVV